MYTIVMYFSMTWFFLQNSIKSNVLAYFTSPKAVLNSESKAESWCLRFFVLINWFCLEMSIHTQPQPLNLEVVVHDPSTKYMFSNHVACDSELLTSCDVVGTITFSENQDWHFPTVCLISFWGYSLSLWIIYRFQLFKNIKLSKDIDLYLVLGH